MPDGGMPEDVVTRAGRAGWEARTGGGKSDDGWRACAELAYSEGLVAGRAEERARVVATCNSVEARERLYATFSNDLRERISQNTLRAVLLALGDSFERGEHRAD